MVDSLSTMRLARPRETPEPGDIRLLLVEDDSSIRFALCDMLSDEGFDVTPVVNGRDALNELRQAAPPDVILLDLMMPEMDGFEFLDEVRRHEAWHNLPVIVLTAADLGEEDRCRLEGEIGKMLRKSTGSRDELLATLREAIAGRVRPVARTIRSEHEQDSVRRGQ
jgi:adenylate cyclase